MTTEVSMKAMLASSLALLLFSWGCGQKAQEPQGAQKVDSPPAVGAPGAATEPKEDPEAAAKEAAGCKGEQLAPDKQAKEERAPEIGKAQPEDRHATEAVQGVIEAPYGIDMVRVEPGTFVEGSPLSESGRDDDEKQREVTLTRGFWIGRTEVTQGQWRAVMGDNPSFFSNCGPDCPVEQVSWHDAVEFCNQLSDEERLSRCYTGTGDKVIWAKDCAGYRLPTEAEWEYAARAGTSSAVYTGALTIGGESNGPELDAIAWYGGNSGVSYSGGFDCSGWPEKQYSSNRCGTHPVGQKKPNGNGLYDVLGNVWEWTWDWYGAYSGDNMDPAGPEAGLLRVGRGGSWSSNAGGVRTANRLGRIWLVPSKKSFERGLRLCRSF